MENTSTLIALAAIGVLVVIGLLIVVARQIVVSRQDGAFECTLQRSTLRGMRWQHGLMRFGTDRLRWYHAVSVRVRPSVQILRREIVGVDRVPLPAQDDGSEDSCLVEMHLRGDRLVRAIIDLHSGAALNAWLESAPTGVVIGDAD